MLPSVSQGMFPSALYLGLTAPSALPQRIFILRFNVPPLIHLRVSLDYCG
ncbi:hypothetical protein M422DRAFT_783990 [Sphaerobolus stellatus SS14]|uniref:Uncharacterized protein n=1 Tax=Sphaerobolus stellatus (strain SS14) TaxID=990650 RepID=A0A0C9TKT8_SPHS4|nr:hypothetical protein M422DRAFT_783990 [Sphaerobolus stellatus SS14]